MKFKDVLVNLLAILKIQVAIHFYNIKIANRGRIRLF